MSEPLSSERLAEIRDLNVDSCSADAQYNPDVWALEYARMDLLAEVDRLKAELAQVSTRADSADAVILRALAEVEHEEVVYLLSRYLTSRPAVSE